MADSESDVAFVAVSVGSYGLAPTPPPSLPYQMNGLAEGVKCALCQEPYREPKVLACFHSFCKACLERQLDTSEKIVCPQCRMETQLSVHLGIDSLLSDFGLESVMHRQLSFDDKLHSNPLLGMHLGGAGAVGGGALSTPSAGLPPHFATVGQQHANHQLPLHLQQAAQSAQAHHLHAAQHQAAAAAFMAAGILGGGGGGGGSSGSGSATGYASPSSTSSTPPLSDSPTTLDATSGGGNVSGGGVHSSLSLSSSSSGVVTSGGPTTTSSSSSSSLGGGILGLPMSAGSIGGIPMVKPTCTGCKSSEHATNFCSDCGHFLCTNCTMAHQYMHCFEGHRVEPITAPVAQHLWEAAQQANAAAITSAIEANMPRNQACKCLQHRSEDLRFFCITCNLAICAECVLADHSAPTHHYADISEVADMQIAAVETLVNDARHKQAELLDMFKQVDSANNRLNASLARAHAVLDDNLHVIIRTLEDQRKFLAKEIEASYSEKQLKLAMVDKRIQQMSDKLGQTIYFTSRLVKNASPTEVMVFKQLLDTRLQMFLMFNPDSANVLSTPCEVELAPLNAQTVRAKLSGLLGAPKDSAADWPSGVTSAMSGMPPTPIGRPPSRQANGMMSSAPMPVPGGADRAEQLLRGTPPASSYLESLPPSMGSRSAGIPIPKQGSPPVDMLSTSVQSMGGLTGTPFGSVPSDYSNYEKWSSALEPTGLGLLDAADLDGVDKSGSAAFCPPRSQIKRQKMIYHCKFGEFGVMEGQFTEPSGVAVNGQGDIVVADTNNHRIQVFDKEGRFKFQFGECGKRDGQLLYPNRVAVNKVTGEFIVTERSPTHQIQVYNQYGQFVRKFGANILQHPRGVCVDSKGRIIVVECKVMRVIIFDMHGTILQKFSCSRYLEFPNGVCTNDKGEILISDNRAHCIKVFSYEGQFIRQIGGEGVTNYPIGVGITTSGDVVVADNHNNFNLTVFAPDGSMVGALESKVKHAQCFDVALVDDGSVVLASKDYRLYLYRFGSGAAVPLL